MIKNRMNELSNFQTLAIDFPLVIYTLFRLVMILTFIEKPTGVILANKCWEMEPGHVLGQET